MWLRSELIVGCKVLLIFIIVTLFDKLCKISIAAEVSVNVRLSSQGRQASVLFQ